MIAVDYTHVPQVPQDPFFEGVEVSFEIAGGTLMLAFEDTSLGSWVFIREGSDPLAGWLDYAALKGDDVMGSSGLFIGDRPLVSNLTTTAMEIDFDRAIHEELSIYVDITLSYHTRNSGWAEFALLNNFFQVYDRVRVPFTIQWPE
ncbi:MAG: hypothetical protein LR015_14795 [Verrucomicrobia bacterium]|nr:hypothetical protein [Verrucomicrobiota bacterium]